MASLDLSGKTVFITGASSGIGQATARAFAAQGARLLLAARRKDRLEEAAAEIGAKAIPIATDVTSSSSVRAAFSQLAERFERIDWRPSVRC